MISAIRRAWRPQTTVFLVLWLGLLAFGRDRMMRDPGTLWHTVVGERILQTGQLIRTDPFSYTLADQPWIAQQWLGECAMALAHRVAGLDALLLGAATVLAALFAWVAGRLLRCGLAAPVAAVLVLLAVAASSYHFMPRPHLATILLMGVTFALLLDAEAGRRRANTVLCILPMLMIVWTNLHGGALGGLATIVFVLVGWLFWPSQLASNDRSSPWVIAAGACLCGLAMLVNPYGAQLPRVWIGLAGSDTLPKLIVEHAPMRWLSVEGAMTAALAAVYLVVLATAWSSRVRLSWFVPLIWLILAATRVRHGPLFAVSAALTIAEMLPHAALPAWLAARGLSLMGRPAPPSPALAAACVPIALVLGSLLVKTTGVSIPLVGAGWARLSPRYWPVAATEALRTRLAHGAIPKVFNDLRYGGYLIYRLPQVRVFIDDRCELYGDVRLRQYVEMHREPQTGEAVAREADYALMRRGTPLERRLSQSPEWETLHRDETAVLLGRASDHDALDVSRSAGSASKACQ